MNMSLLSDCRKRFSLIDLKLTVPTESEAEAIAGNWASQSQDIYTLLLAKLL